MKVKAPEKIYILYRKDYSDLKICNAFTEKEKDADIEYIRTDAFIEKAVKWMKENADKYIEIKDGALQLRRSLYSQFKKAMKL